MFVVSCFPFNALLQSCSAQPKLQFTSTKNVRLLERIISVSDMLQKVVCRLAR